ncbi:MAG TPA: methylated-DNA--[protein]-cysteine S-methyltransferase [Pirellulales bacterium]|jgi:methylated-DNA-[protein]-cysteine S-methyltransferase|nr:methylated-DNA--[protein]-cysteine S-methyltransferase [Pirellulales bacterium]
MTTTTYYSYIDWPLGRLFLRGDGQFLTGLFMQPHKGGRAPDGSWQQSDAPFTAVREQLAEYFAGERQQFDVPIKLAGTPFQQCVWQELVRIPFGTSISYGQLAQRVGKPTASRAVGQANGRNPISIIVPCHRVIGADGKLTGYGGGVDKKKWLLGWERSATVAAPRSLFDATVLSEEDFTRDLSVSDAPLVLPRQ